MKVLTLKFGEKTYTTGKLTAFLAREVMKVGKQALELAKTQKSYADIEVNSSEYDLDKAAELVDAIEELSNKSAWIICEAYGNKFTMDELEKNLSTQEINAEINRITAAITGTMEKK